MSCLAKAKVEREASALSRLDFLPIRIFPPHALVIVVSSLTPTDRYLFQRLRAYGYQVLLVSPDPIRFASPIVSQDATDQLAIRAATIERRLQLNEVSQLQIPVVDWQVDQPLFPLVRNALTRSRGQQEI
jgi:transposase